MDNLSNLQLIETYSKAQELELAEIFIQLIEDELIKRNFTVEEERLLKQVDEKFIEKEVTHR